MTQLGYGSQTQAEAAQREADDFDKFADNFDNETVAALSVNYPEMAQYLQPDVQFEYEIPGRPAVTATPGGYDSSGKWVAPTGQQTWAPNDLGVLAPSYADIPATEAQTVRVGPAPEPPPPDLGIFERPYESLAGLRGTDYQLANAAQRNLGAEPEQASNRDWLVQMGYSDWYPVTEAERIGALQGGRPFVLKDVTGGGEVYPAVYGAGVPSPIGERGGVQQPGGRYAAPGGNIYQRQAPAGISYGESPGGLGIFERVPDVSGITDVLPPSGGLPNPPPPAAPIGGQDSGVPAALAMPDISNRYTAPPPPGEGGATLINTGNGVWWWDGGQWLSSNDRPELTLFNDMPPGNYRWSPESGWVPEQGAPAVETPPVTEVPPASEIPPVTATPPVSEAPPAVEVPPAPPVGTTPVEGAVAMWGTDTPLAVTPGLTEPAASEALRVEADGTVYYRDPTGNWFSYNSKYTDMQNPEAAQFVAAASRLGPGQYEWQQSSAAGGDWQRTGDVEMPVAPAPAARAEAPGRPEAYGSVPDWESYLWQKMSAAGLQDYYNVARHVMRAESGDRPGAANMDRGTRDNSIGLFQINMIDEPGNAMGTSRANNWFGVSREEGINRLYDPYTNIDIAVDRFMAPLLAQAAARGLYGADAARVIFRDWSTMPGAVRAVYGA